MQDSAGDREKTLGLLKAAFRSTTMSSHGSVYSAFVAKDCRTFPSWKEQKQVLGNRETTRTPFLAPTRVVLKNGVPFRGPFIIRVP